MKSKIAKAAAALLLLALALIALAIGASPSAWLWILALALLLAKKRFKRAPWLAAALLIAPPAGRAYRLYAPGPIQLISLPSGEAGHPLSVMVDERDGTLLVGALLFRSGRFNRREAAEFLPSLRQTYDEMPDLYPTPAVATYLGLQSPERSDAVLIKPPRPSKNAVVFLHGFAGNFTVYCWQFSRAARAINAATLCPSVGPAGDWWRAHGLRTTRAAISYLRRKGYTQIYLAGLSNGSVGAGDIASKVDVEGLILISGAPNKPPVPGLRTLMVHGTRDTMARVSAARRYARAPDVSLFELNSGHFVFLDRAEAVREKIAAWLGFRP